MDTSDGNSTDNKLDKKPEGTTLCRHSKIYCPK